MNKNPISRRCKILYRAPFKMQIPRSSSTKLKPASGDEAQELIFVRNSPSWSLKKLFSNKMKVTGSNLHSLPHSASFLARTLLVMRNPLFPPQHLGSFAWMFLVSLKCVSSFGFSSVPLVLFGGEGPYMFFLIFLLRWFLNQYLCFQSWSNIDYFSIFPSDWTSWNQIYDVILIENL